MNQVKIMIVEDRYHHRQIINNVLKEMDLIKIYVSNPQDIDNHIELDWVIEKFEEHNPDILLLDMAWTASDEKLLDELTRSKNLVEFWNRNKSLKKEPQVFQFLEYIKDKPVITIILTGYSKEIDVVLNEILNNRADRIILQKPHYAEDAEYKKILSPIVSKCINAQKFILNSQIGVIRKTRSAIELLNNAMVSANTDVPILITGETGIGKTNLAKAIHTLSHRSKGPFIERNIASIPHELFYSTLFGHEKGAFTGAIKYKPGILEMAEAGTVFLDEIGDLPETEQVHLLKALEENQVYPLGGEDSKPVKINIRYILATNKNIEQLVKEGKFRKDLYYRISVVQLSLPPLRDRKDDIPIFVDYYLDKFFTELKKERYIISENDMARIKQYQFPGNIRQLSSIIYRAVLFNISIQESINSEKNIDSKEDSGMLDFTTFLWNKLFVEKSNLKEILHEIEISLVQKADEWADNNTLASNLLGISISSFENKKRLTKKNKSG